MTTMSARVSEALAVAVTLLCAAALAVGCSCSDPSTSDGDGGGSRDAGAMGRDGGAQPDAATMTDAGVDAGPIDAGPPPPPELRFVVMGDTGEGNEAQHAVADAISTVCAADGCDFVILLGDNFYDSGVTSVDDEQWTSAFEEPYSDIELPFYSVLGNHDYGGSFLGISLGGLGNDFEQGQHQVDYSRISMKWTMPDTFYTFQMEHVGFVMMDTNSIFWDSTDNGDQAAWYAGAVADLRASGAEWILAAGHHPYLSNGRHGNAGNYEAVDIPGIDSVLRLLPDNIIQGSYVRNFFDTYVCGTADMYFAGHDHNRQWLNEPDALCGTEMIVSGAGAKVTEWGVQGNETFWQDNTQEGFLWVEIVGDTFTGRFYDRTGAMNFERSFTRPAP